MKNNFVLLSIMLLIPLFLIIGSRSYSYTFSNESPQEIFTTTPIPNVKEQPSVLEVRIDSLENLIEIQSQSFNATVSRWESNLNLILSIIGIVSILIAIFGITAFKYWVKNQITEQYKKAVGEELNLLIKKEMDDMRKEWDPKFAALYDEYRKSSKGK